MWKSIAQSHEVMECDPLHHFIYFDKISWRNNYAIYMEDIVSDTPQRLFPPYLNTGSYGGAVDKLHIILQAFGFGEGIVPDLEYGNITATRVANLQRGLGVEADGNFGPATRAALKKETGFDVDAITWAPQDGVTAWEDGKHDRLQIWPPVAE